MTYLERLADEIRDEVPADALPPEDTRDLFLGYAVLLLAKGEDISGEDIHNTWVAWMAARGQEHESMRPFSELPLSTKDEDSPFVLAIRRVAERRRK